MIDQHKASYDKQKVMELSEQLKKRNSDKCFIIETLKALLNCDDIESSELYYNHVSEIDELEWAKTNIQYLLGISVNRETIKKYGFLLAIPLGIY